jgi:hypothetical protein
MGYVTLEQAKEIFDSIQTPEEAEKKVRESIKKAHIHNVETAKSILVLNNLKKHHLRMIESYEEKREKWRFDLISRIDERIQDFSK